MRHDYRSRPQLAFKRKTHEESESPIESLKRVALCPLLEPDGGENGEERLARLCAPIWHRSRSQQIEIDNSNCRRLPAAFAPRLLPTNCPSGLGSPSLANSTPTRRRWRLEEWNFRIRHLTKLWSIISVSRIPYCHNVGASIQV